MNYPRMLTVMRTDLKQLRQSKDFWVPMALLGGLFFVVVPAILLSVINSVGNVGAVQQVSQALQLLPQSAQEAVPQAASRRHQGVVRAGRLPVRADRGDRAAHHLDRGRRRARSSASASGAPASSWPTPPPACARSTSAS